MSMFYGAKIPDIGDVNEIPAKGFISLRNLMMRDAELHLPIDRRYQVRIHLDIGWEARLCQQRKIWCMYWISGAGRDWHCAKGFQKTFVHRNAASCPAVSDGCYVVVNQFSQIEPQRTLKSRAIKTYMPAPEGLVVIKDDGNPIYGVGAKKPFIEKDLAPLVAAPEIPDRW